MDIYQTRSIMVLERDMRFLEVMLRYLPGLQNHIEVEQPSCAGSRRVTIKNVSSAGHTGEAVIGMFYSLIVFQQPCDLGAFMGHADPYTFKGFLEALQAWKDDQSV
jgi:hypothetical protein